MWQTGFTLDSAAFLLSHPSAEVGERVAALVQALFATERQTHTALRPVASVQLFDHYADVGPPPPRLTQVQADRRLSVWTTPCGFLLEAGQTWLAVDQDASRASGVLDSGFWAQSLLAQRDFLLLAFVMLLRPHGFYALHANAVVAEGRGFCIVGASGSGKTTLSLSLLRAGWQYLADDALLLADEPSGVVSLALRRSFACTAQTLARFPELADAASGASATSKGVVAVEQIYPTRFVSRCTPAVLLFPRIAGGPRSRLLPLDPTAALCALLPQSAGIFTRRGPGERQLATLARLCQQARSYTMLLADDVYAEPELVGALLHAA
jgi:hypothetical protein